MSKRIKIEIDILAEQAEKHRREDLALSAHGRKIAYVLREAYSGPNKKPSPLTITQATALQNDPDLRERLKALL